MTLADHRHTVSVVRYGTRRGRRHEMFLGEHLSDVSRETSIDMDYFFWVVSGPSGVFLVDTGFSRAGGEARNRQMLVDPLEIFACVGAAPDSAPTVIATHGHYDHIGNLPAFSSSPVVMAEAEYEFWTGPLATRALFAHSTDPADVAALRDVASEGRLQTFAGSLQIAPGITLLEVGGHTPGQCVVLVETDAGTVLLTSDAAHYYEEFEADRPFSVVADLPAMYRSFDRINQLVADGVVDLVVAGHDPDVVRRLERFATGDDIGVVAVIGSRREEPQDG